MEEVKIKLLAEVYGVDAARRAYGADEVTDILMEREKFIGLISDAHRAGLTRGYVEGVASVGRVTTKQEENGVTT